MTAQDIATASKSLADSHDKLEQQVYMLTTELAVIAEHLGVEPELNKVVNEIKRVRARLAELEPESDRDFIDHG